MSMEPHVRRAFAAYFRAGGADQPSASSGIRSVGNRRYVHLENVRGTLAIFRIEHCDRLKRLKRWPTALTGGQANG